MKDSLYELIIDRFCFDNFYLKNVRVEEPNGMFKSTKRDYDLIVFNSKKIILFIQCDESLNKNNVVYALRGALNSLVSKLSLSLNDFVVCGTCKETCYFLNKYNDRLFSFSSATDECFKIIEYIENDLSYVVDAFDYARIRSLRDILTLTSSTDTSTKTKEKVKEDASGKTLVNVHGIWREASLLNTEILYRLSAFGGMFGLHLFYQKKWGKGALYLFTLGLCGVGWFFDCIEILFGIYKDPEGKYLVPLENKVSGLVRLLLGGVVFATLGLILNFCVSVYL